MITREQYFGAKPHDTEQEIAADDLLVRVNELVEEAVKAGAFSRNIDPDTGTEISGSRNGAGDGGFRLPTARTGSATSAHKEAKGVDVFDSSDRLDEWLDQFEHGVGGNTKLEEHGLYREAPSATPGWCHLQTRPTKSGRRTFIP